MSRTYRCCFAWNSFLAICGLGIQSLPGQTPPPGVQLVVGVYNYAAVPADTLDRAEQQAAKILGRAGIEMHWVDCPVLKEDAEKLRRCLQAEASGGHYLEFLPQSMAARHQGDIHRFGYGVPPHFAYVFAAKAQTLAKDAKVSLPVILGFVIAHELGHLLLPAESHSSAGIMCEDLAIKDLRRAEEGILLAFSTEQAQRMRVRLQEESNRCAPNCR